MKQIAITALFAAWCLSAQNVATFTCDPTVSAGALIKCTVGLDAPTAQPMTIGPILSNLPGGFASQQNPLPFVIAAGANTGTFTYSIPAATTATSVTLSVPATTSVLSTTISITPQSGPTGPTVKVGQITIAFTLGPQTAPLISIQSVTCDKTTLAFVDPATGPADFATCTVTLSQPAPSATTAAGGNGFLISTYSADAPLLLNPATAFIIPTAATSATFTVTRPAGL